jgi:hypothetical protein
MQREHLRQVIFKHADEGSSLKVATIDESWGSIHPRWFSAAPVFMVIQPLTASATGAKATR